MTLLAAIEATGARDVFVTGAGAEAIVAAIGPRARVIGPPHQMSLFPRDAFSLTLFGAIEATGVRDVFVMSMFPRGAAP